MVSDEEWDNMRVFALKNKEQLQDLNCVIKNLITGKYVCNADNSLKTFTSKDDATMFLNRRRLSTVYEIEYI